jgi:hypothetical protein
VAGGNPVLRKLVLPQDTADGLGDLCRDATGRLVFFNGSRVVPLVDETETHHFTYQGDLAVYTGIFPVYFEYPVAIDVVRASLGTAPAGAAAVFDVLRNGTTSIWAATPANRPTIAAGATTAVAGTPGTPTFAAGDFMIAAIDSIGSTTPGADLILTVRARRT